MKKIIISMLVLIAWTTSLTAQITREQADSIVLEYIQKEVTLYVNINTPNEEGITITTSNQETFKTKYACWAYYLDENESSQRRYLFVKENNGNLLEIIAKNDISTNDLTQWTVVDKSTGLIAGKESNIKTLYPNPTTNTVYIKTKNGTVPEVKLFSISGIMLQHVRSTVIDMSSYPAGIYFVQVEGETMKIIKN